jgi:hypothetical protein
MNRSRWPLSASLLLTLVAATSTQIGAGETGCSGNPIFAPSIIVNNCYNPDGTSGDCSVATSNNGAGLGETPASGTDFTNPFGSKACVSQFDCTGVELDQCLRASCSPQGLCEVVVAITEPCIAPGLACVVGQCMPTPSGFAYPAFCSFSTFGGPSYNPTVVPGNCLIEQACFADADLNPENECQVCAPPDGMSSGAWANVADGTSCGAGSGTCQTGECVENEDTTDTGAGGDETTGEEETTDTTGGTTEDDTTGDDTTTTDGDTGDTTSGDDTDSDGGTTETATTGETTGETDGE